MAEPRFITYDQALRLHHHSIENYGGSHGLRDQGALESALAMPEAGFGGEYMHSSLFDKAAAYLYHIIAQCSCHSQWAWRGVKCDSGVSPLIPAFVVQYTV